VVVWKVRAVVARTAEKRAKCASGAVREASQVAGRWRCENAARCAAYARHACCAWCGSCWKGRKWREAKRQVVRGAAMLRYGAPRRSVTRVKAANVLRAAETIRAGATLCGEAVMSRTTRVRVVVRSVAASQRQSARRDCLYCRERQSMHHARCCYLQRAAGAERARRQRMEPYGAQSVAAECREVYACRSEVITRRSRSKLAIAQCGQKTA